MSSFGLFWFTCYYTGICFTIWSLLNTASDTDQLLLVTSASSYLVWSIISGRGLLRTQGSSRVPNLQICHHPRQRHIRAKLSHCVPSGIGGTRTSDSQSQRVFVRDLSSTPRCVRQNTCYTQWVLSRKPSAYLQSCLQWSSLGSLSVPVRGPAPAHWWTVGDIDNLRGAEITSQSASSYLAWSQLSLSWGQRPGEDTSLIPCPQSPDQSSSSPETH